MRTLHKILVTGGAGFIGSELVSLLLGRGYQVIVVDDLSKGKRDSLPQEGAGFHFIKSDLRDRALAMRYITTCDWVIHLASQAYGVARCSKAHADTLLLNSQINANVVEAVVRNGIQGLLAVSSSCVYADDAPDVMSEDLGFHGEPEQANWGYGWAKRMLEVAVNAAIKDRLCEGVIVRPVNIYGANYGWFGEDSHVIPSLVKRLFDGEDPLTVWGDGTQARSFMHVRDAVRAFLELSLHAPDGTTVNLGDEQATSTNDIVSMLKELFAMKTKIQYDPNRPTGRRIKSVSSKHFREVLPEFTPAVDLTEGLTEMKHWYDRHSRIGSFDTAS